MRPLRSLLAVATVAVVGATSGAASAAPPVGCYGFPSIPSAFVCVVSFTPENAVPGGSVDPDDSTVTIPAFCAGDCYGPFTVPVPGVDLSQSSGQIAVIVYNGQAYPIGGGIPSMPPVGIPPIPEIPPVGLPPMRSCSGDVLDASPFVCVHNDTGDGELVVGTCLTTPCRTVGIPLWIFEDVEPVVQRVCMRAPVDCGE